MYAKNITVWLYNPDMQEYVAFQLNDKSRKNSIKKGHALIKIMRCKRSSFYN